MFTLFKIKITTQIIEVAIYIRYSDLTPVRNRNSCSISAKLRPRVSGRYLITKNIASTPIAAKLRIPILYLNYDLKLGIIVQRLTYQSLILMLQCLLLLLLRVGNNSGNMTHKTGPHEIPKNTMNNDKQIIMTQADD